MLHPREQLGLAQAFCQVDSSAGATVSKTEELKKRCGVVRLERIGSSVLEAGSRPSGSPFSARCCRVRVSHTECASVTPVRRRRWCRWTAWCR